MSDNIPENPSQSLEGRTEEATKDVSEEPIGVNRLEFCGSLALFIGGISVVSYKVNEWELAKKIKKSWTGNFLKDRYNLLLRQKILDDMVQEIGGKDKNIKIMYSEDVKFSVNYDPLRYNLYNFNQLGKYYSYVLQRKKDAKSVKSEIRIYPDAYQLFRGEFAMYLMACLSYVKNVTPAVEIEDRKIPDHKFRFDDITNLWIIKSNYDFINMLVNHSHQVSPRIIGAVMSSANHLKKSSENISSYAQYHKNFSPFLSKDEEDTFEYFLKNYSKGYFEVLSEYLKKHNLSQDMLGKFRRNIPKPKGGPNTPNST